MRSLVRLVVCVTLLLVGSEFAQAQCLAGTTIQSHTRIIDNGNGCASCAAPNVLLHLIHSGQPQLKLTHNGATGSCTEGIHATLSMYEGTDRYSILEATHDYSLVSGTGAGHLILSTRNSERWIKFATTPTTGVPDIERMCIRANGDVGIGTTSPDCRLSIKSSFGDNTTTALKVSNVFGNVLAVVQNGGNTGIGQSAPKEKLHVGDLMTFHDGGAKFMGFNAYYDVSTSPNKNKNLQGDRASVAMGIGDPIGNPDMFTISIDKQTPAGTEVFTGDFKGLCLLTDGKMGVGTLAPKCTLHVWGDVAIGELKNAASDAKLSVDGTIYAKELIVTTTVWEDSVFSQNYELPSLASIERYIEENGHLPEIPSEAEVFSRGFAVSDMTAKLLKNNCGLFCCLCEINSNYTCLS